MAESWKIKWIRWRFNWFPPFRRTGARVTFISEDLLEARMRLPLDWRTRNPHGAIYGGALYSAVDPIHAVIIARKLGPGYIVWIKVATIHFKRPSRTPVTAHVKLLPREIEEIRQDLQGRHKTDKVFDLDILDSRNLVTASVKFTIHIQRAEKLNALESEETLQPEL